MSDTATRISTQPAVSFTARYQQLNEQQRLAVDAIDGVVMVLAGPGTGKTELLAMRVGNILRRTQLNPSNILCLTFTESGVVALRQRLLSIIGEAAYQVRVHTFHSFANEVIQEWPERFSFARELAVLTDLERAQLWQDLLDELPATSTLKTYANPYLFLPDILRAVQQLKQEHIDPAAYAEVMDQTAQLIAAVGSTIAAFAARKPAERTVKVCEELHVDCQALRPTYARLHFHFDTLDRFHAHLESGLLAVEGKREQQKLCTQYKNEVKRWFTRLQSQLPKQQELIGRYERYQQALQQRGRYDYEDMILLVLDRLRTDDELLAYYQEQCQYFLVDEYQDTNGAQNDLLFTLAEFMDEPNLFVVGDDHQSIYRFQGASLANLLSLHQRYHDQIQLITLTDNYRSPQAILDAASHLIAHNTSNIETYLPTVTRTLTSQSPVTTKQAAVRVIAYPTETDERVATAQHVAALITAGVPARQIAILTRRNTEARQLMPILQSCGVTAQLLARENIVTKAPIQQLLNLLRLVAGDITDYRLWQVLHGPWFAIPPVELARAQQLARSRGSSLLNVLTTPELLAAATLQAVDRSAEVVAQLLQWQVLAVTELVDQTLPTILNDSGYVTYFGDIVLQPAVLEYASLLVSEARSLLATQPALTLAGFITHLDMLAQHDIDLAAEFPHPRDAVQVLTAHRAKGLEWEQVFIMHTMDGRWGNRREHNLVALPHGLVQHQAGEYDPDEDERRLLYVAMTRAKQQVTISYSTTSAIGKPLVASKFMYELPVTVATITAGSVASVNELLAPTLRSPLAKEHRRELTDWLTDQLAHYTMSVTHLNNYLECPRLWYYRNLLQAPAAKTKHMAFGTAVHAALFDLFGAKGVSQHYLLERFTYHLHREVLADKDLSDSEELGRQVLSAYFTRNHTKFVPAVAREFSFTGHGIHVDDLRLTGKIDKVELVNKKSQQVNVIDYKTGNPDGKSAALNPGGTYHRQLVFYQLLANQSKQFNYTMVSGEIDFVQPSKRTGKFVKSRIMVSDDEVAGLTQEIRTVWADMKQLAFLEAPLCGKCEYCQAI